MASTVKSVLRSVVEHPLTGSTLRTAVNVTGYNRALIRQYLKSHPVAKLQLGAGGNRLPGWLNTDYLPLRHKAVLVDAIRRFPFADDVFDYAHSEHMIEHLPFSGAKVMLAELFRVLKPGGTLRLLTPDLQFLIGLLQPDLSPLQRAYLTLAGETLPGGLPPTPTGVVNNYVRAWGHQFIFDAPTLEDLFRTAGFVDVQRFAVNASDDPNLTGIDNPERMPAGFLQLESLVYQVRKPGL